MIYLKQSTASQEVLLGPFLDDTDGKTAETALTIANTDIKIWKAGATAEANKASGGATHIAAGRYYAVLDATDTNTLGSGEINVHVAGALPVKVRFTVLAANVYDALIGGGDLLDVNLAQISEDAVAADNLEAIVDGTAGSVPLFGILDRGTAQSATSTTMVLRSAAAFADDSLIGCIIMQTGGTNAPQVALITDNVLSTDTVTVGAWPNGTPGGTITYQIFGTVQNSGGAGLDAAGVRSAVGLAAANLDTQLGSILTKATDVEVDTQNLQSRVPAALVSGRMDANVGAMAANTLTAAATAADFGTEVATAVWAATTRLLTAGTNIVLAKGAGITGFNDLSAAQVNAEVDTAIADAALATAANLSIVAGYLDTEMAAVKAVTDKLDQMLVLDGAVYQFTVNALELGPSGSGASAATIAAAVWDEALGGHATAGTSGAALTTAASASGMDAAGMRAALGMAAADLDTQLDAIKTDTAAAVSDTGAIKAKTDNLPTDPADASVVAALISALPQSVWEHAISTGYPAERLLRVISAAVAGKTNTSGTVMRDVTDTQDMITATITGSDRTSVTHGA